MKVGDLVQHVSSKGCKEWLGFVVCGLDHHGLVKVYWFDGINNPRPWQPEELEVISESR